MPPFGEKVTDNVPDDPRSDGPTIPPQRWALPLKEDLGCQQTPLTGRQVRVDRLQKKTPAKKSPAAGSANPLRAAFEPSLTPSQRRPVGEKLESNGGLET